jgi:adenine-specific DNA-methyltransferase
MAEALHKEGKSANDIVTHIARHLLGNDLDPVLARLSTQFLRMAIYPEIISSGNDPTLYVSVSDGLTGLEEWIGKVDVVICNPPYRKMKKVEVEPYLTKFVEVSQGQTNIYAMFFQQALRLVRHDGLTGLLTPTSFLSGQDFSKLRTFLLQNSNTLQLDMVRAREGIFIGVNQETVISIHQRKSLEKIIKAEPKVFVFDHVTGFKSVGRCHLPNSGMAWPVPRQEGDADVIRAVQGKRHTLKDYGYLARVGAFVDYRDTRNTYVSETDGAKASALLPLLRSRDINANGRLEHGRARNGLIQSKFIDMGDPNHKSIIRRPCIALQRVTSTDQPRRLISAPVDPALIKKFGGVVGENHVVFIEKVDEGALLTPSQLAKVLRSEPIDKLFRCISGAVNVSIFELNQLPLPCPKAMHHALDLTKNINDAVKKAFDARGEN